MIVRRGQARRQMTAEEQENMRNVNYPQFAMPQFVDITHITSKIDDGIDLSEPEEVVVVELVDLDAIYETDNGDEKNG